jgi:hypothetical protein
MNDTPTPTDVIAEWSRLTPTMAYSMLSDEAVAGEIIRCLAAAGYRITAVEPERCPTCGSPHKGIRLAMFPDCPDAWHTTGGDQ